MKKPHLKLSYCILFIFIYSINNYAQESKPVQTSDAKLPKNEVKINAFTLIAFGAIDITYERVLNNESSAGISIYVLGQNNIDSEFYRTFSLTPYYRSYFSDMYNKGFFIELFAMAYSREDEYYNSYDSIENGDTTSNYETEKHTGAALGISVGGKWVTKTGFIAEISLGIGRVMIGNTNDEVPVVGRGGITIGKRF
tara:strand:- start:46 stop:636 length:591 start_codon:yes stop_codon:yes gene_type:complete